MTIQATFETLTLSLDVAAALVAFASKDTTRPHLGVGIDDGAVCATDGHRAVQFKARDVAIKNSRVWSRAHVETAIKVSRAQRAATVVLNFADCLLDSVFPRVAHVIPEQGFCARESVGLDPALLAGLEKVCKACGVKGAKLTALRGSLDPVRFDAVGPTQDATVVLMPMRI